VRVDVGQQPSHDIRARPDRGHQPGSARRGPSRGDCAARSRRRV
jgi:hypothetical protein